MTSSICFGSCTQGFPLVRTERLVNQCLLLIVPDFEQGLETKRCLRTVFLQPFLTMFSLFVTFWLLHLYSTWDYFRKLPMKQQNEGLPQVVYFVTTFLQERKASVIQRGFLNSFAFWLTSSERGIFLGKYAYCLELAKRAGVGQFANHLVPYMAPSQLVPQL